MIRGRAYEPREVCDILEPYLTPERIRRICDVVASRTRSVVTVVEGISNYGNLSAVMRTAEGLGFLEVHVVTRDQPYKQSRRTSQGAEKWLDIHVWDRPQPCIGDLRSRDYQIVVADAGLSAVPLDRVDFLRKTAVVFGNELEGVSASMIDHADVVCRIDLSGFVESYNISVAAALVLYHAHQARRQSHGAAGDLTGAEQQLLRAHYYLRAVPNGERIVQEISRRTDRSG